MHKLIHVQFTTQTELKLLSAYKVHILTVSNVDNKIINQIQST